MESNSGQNHITGECVINPHYDILEMIDYGSFGDVLKVQKVEGSRVYALKQIKFRGSFRDDPYIINEIYCLTHLQHKNIINMHEIIIDDGEIDIIMEYAENENLERYIAQNDKMEFLTKFKIYSQILQGVEYCHSMDIAHRDLTPGNILLTSDMVVKIADFGLAVRCTADDDSPVLCSDYLGRASYLSPEVLAQKPYLPKPSDIWSLGVLLLYLIFHSIPFKDFETDILQAQIAETWKDFVQVKSKEQKIELQGGVIDVIAHALHLDPNMRSNVRDIVLAWDDIGPEPFGVQ